MYAVFKESLTGGCWVTSTSPLAYDLTGSNSLFLSMIDAKLLADDLTLSTGEEHFVQSESYARSNPTPPPSRP